MSKRLSSLRIVGICIFMIMSGAWLTSCGAERLTANQFVPTPVGVAPVSPLSQPTWLVGEQGVWGFLVTPLPNEKVQIGEIAEITETKAITTSILPQRYSIREQIPPGYTTKETLNQLLVYKLYVKDSETGKEVRLGDDNGDALFGVMTDQYIIWRYRCYTCESTNLKTGLYAYVLATGKDIIIAQSPGYQWHVEVDNQWVIYADFHGANGRGFADLRVHNLETGEDSLVGRNIPFPGNQPANDYYALSEDKVTWVEVGAAAKEIHVYDLVSHITHTLDVPDLLTPTYLSISGDIIVWWDRFWRGYDLRQNAIFTIPTIPTGWEKVPVQPAGTVTVKNDQLYWSLEVNDKVYRFTAPLIREK